jgi:hypothetical protein
MTGENDRRYDEWGGLRPPRSSWIPLLAEAAYRLRRERDRGPTVAQHGLSDEARVLADVEGGLVWDLPGETLGEGGDELGRRGLGRLVMLGGQRLPSSSSSSRVVSV